MEYRQLGKSGLKVSSVGLGCNNFGMAINIQQTAEVVGAALDHGITLFDTADIYGNGDSERFLGKALGGNRSNAVVATKFGNPIAADEQTGGASRRYILSAVESSLRRLKTDYIDLYQLHTPDPDTPLDETLRALDDLVRSGKVRYLGCSNFSSWQVVDSQWISRQLGLERFITAQNRYSILSRRAEEDLLPACKHSNVSLLPFFPLESGLLTGKYATGQEPEEGTRWHAWKDRGAFAESFFSTQRLSQVDRLREVSNRFSHSLLELAFGWLLNNTVVGSVIAGATNPDQIVANVEAGLFRPSEEETSLINDISAAPISATAWSP